MNLIKMRTPLFSFMALTCLQASCQMFQNTVPNDQPELRVFTRYSIDPVTIDPAKYGEASEYDYVTYLFSPLVQYDKKAQIVGGLSDKFYWEGNDLVFEIRDGLKSSAGAPITAEDAALSFKRYHILTPEKAKEFFQEICSGKAIRSLQDDCPGLISEKNTLRLRFQSKKPIYLDILTGADFAVVPKSAYNQQTLEMLETIEGTGPYKLVEISKKESFIKLEARRDHWLWKPTVPQRVVVRTFFSKDGKELDSAGMEDLFIKKQVDLLPTFAGPRGLTHYIRDKKSKKYSTFISHPTSTYVMFFSEKAKKEFTPKERLFIADSLRRAFYEDSSVYEQSPGAVKTNEFFPKSSDGSLSSEQLEKYEALIKEARSVKLKRTPKLHVIEAYMQSVVEAIRRTRGVITYGNDDSYKMPPNEDFQKRFDGFFSLVNVPTVEGVDSIFWLKAMKWLPFSEEENNQWVKKYLEEEDKQKRVLMLKDLHFQMLTQATVVPSDSFDYSAVAYKPWNLNFSPLFPNTPLWEIEYSP